MRRAAPGYPPFYVPSQPLMCRGSREIGAFLNYPLLTAGLAVATCRASDLRL